MIGGPVSTGSLYRGKEKGPEVLNVAGKQFLLMGNKGGSVHPSGTGGGNVINHTNNFVLNEPASRHNQQQVPAKVSGADQRAAARNT